MEHNGAHLGQEAEPEENQSEEIIQAETEGRETASMETLLLDEGISLEFPTQGEIRQGFIATIQENEILVSIGTKSEGIISGRELEQIPEEERENLLIGMEIPVYVIAPEDPNGNVVLSYTRAREERDWNDVEGLLESNEIYDSKVIGYNKGGLIVPIGQLRGFVPASQISLLRKPTISGDSPDQRYSKLVGDTIQIRVIEVDRTRRRLILSERLALQETRESLKDRLLGELEIGDVRKGRVTSLADFGAFVNIEGADGLVHLSEISWDRIQHPNELLTVGQEVEVKVISIDQDRKRIGLSLRQLQDDPWLKKIDGLREGMLIEGTVTHLTKFGAFARISDELEGLIHVSELSDEHVAHPKEAIHEGDVVSLRIIKIDPERRRIGLSLRKVDSPAYTDLDWKMELANEVGKSQDEGEDTTMPVEALEQLAKIDVSEEEPLLDEEIIEQDEMILEDEVPIEEEQTQAEAPQLEEIPKDEEEVSIEEEGDPILEVIFEDQTSESLDVTVEEIASSEEEIVESAAEQ